MVEFRPVTDPAALARFIRAPDAAEIHAMGHTIQEGLEVSVEGNRWTASMWVGGEFVAVFGVADLNLIGGLGAPWCFTSDLVTKHRKAFWTASQEWCGFMKSQYHSLLGDVAEDHRASVAWLKRLGFHIAPARPFGPRGVRFHRFTWSKDVH